MNDLEEAILGVYQTHRDLCKRCKEDGKKRYPKLHPTEPVLFFNIGNEFNKDSFKVLFVGKNTWYSKEDLSNVHWFPNCDFRDCREGGIDMFEHDCSPFWQCIREITRKLYENQDLYPQCRKPSGRLDYEKLWERIAVTNLTKCNTSSETGYGDTTPDCFTEQCISLFEEEVKKLQPKHLILFTGKGYDDFIRKLSFVKSFGEDEKNYKDRFKKTINGKEVWWWEGRSFEGEKMSFLRTRHPQGAPKRFTEEVVTWIKRSRG